MDVRDTEPTKVIWAVAEVFWEDGGTPNRAPATIEDTSLSGACLRVKRPFNVGARVTIKWHREQFSSVAKNCRSDRRDFLLGVHRETDGNSLQPDFPPFPTRHRSSRLPLKRPPERQKLFLRLRTRAI